MQGPLEGGKEIGKQKKRHEDNILEWTGRISGRRLTLADTRERWRKLAVKSSMMPPNANGPNDTCLLTMTLLQNKSPPEMGGFLF